MRGCCRKDIMAASPTISSISSLRCRDPPAIAACANTNSFTATCPRQMFGFQERLKDFGMGDEKEGELEKMRKDNRLDGDINK